MKVPDSVERKIPGFWRRAAAAAIDLFLVMTILGMIQTVLVGVTGGRLHADLFERNNKLLSYGYILLTVSWLPFNLYFSLLESSKWQSTLGKRWLGLQVADMQGERTSLGRAILRTTLKFLPWELGHISIMLLANLQVTGLVRDGSFPFTPDTRFNLVEGPWTAPARILAFGLLGVYILGALLQRQGRGLYDLLAGTVVDKAQ